MGRQVQTRARRQKPEPRSGPWLSLTRRLTTTTPNEWETRGTSDISEEKRILLGWSVTPFFASHCGRSAGVECCETHRMLTRCWVATALIGVAVGTRPGMAKLDYNPLVLIHIRNQIQRAGDR